MKRTRLRKSSKARGGATKGQLEKLDSIARALCMARTGAFRIDDTRSWLGVCRKCKLMKPLQWAHFNSRRIHALRWDPDNSMALCGGCHYNFAHHKPGEFKDWWLGQIGRERFEKLALRLKTARRPDYTGLHVALRQEWLQLTGSEFSEAASRTAP